MVLEMMACRECKLASTDSLIRDISLQLKALSTCAVADLPSGMPLLRKAETKSHCVSLLQLFESSAPRIRVLVEFSEEQVAAFRLCRIFIAKIIDLVARE